MKDALIVTLMSVVPKNHVARWMGFGARLRLPRFAHRLLTRWYVHHYKVDLGECVGGIEDFDCLADFFVRGLKPGVRPVDAAAGVLVSPVDARVHTFGLIEGGRFQQAEGRWCSVGELLGVGDPRAPADPAEAARFEGGSYAVLYLSPQDYHRVHTPTEGQIGSYRYLPGKLWPVFAAATRKVESLFARNERLVFHLDSPMGRVAEVMVGAFGVGRMSTVLGPLLTNTGHPGGLLEVVPPRSFERAEELGRFELGSTVILLAEPGRIEWRLTPGAKVKLGEVIAEFGTRSCTLHQA